MGYTKYSHLLHCSSADFVVAVDSGLVYLFLYLNHPSFKQNEGVLIESMDGCFRLCRKKDKGHSLGTPKHGTLLFADQDDVDNFVNSYDKAGADMEQVCT